jgi:large subunit ribosomal protein L17
MMRNMVRSLLLTERERDADEPVPKSKKPAGRIVTTLEKAKEIRPVVERCVTIARRALPALEEANKHGTDAERNSNAWREWRKSDKWKKWSQAMGPVVAARRRVFTVVHDKEAVRILFERVAPRFTDRPGGYTRIVRLPKPRLGDAGTQAILEFVGNNDRKVQRSAAPKFEDSAAR